MKILFLSRWFPMPANNGSKLRILNLLKALGGRHDVTLLSFAEQAGEQDTPKLPGICSEVHTVQWREFDPRSAKAQRGFLSLKPRSIIDTFSPEMAGEISRILGGANYDLVIASQLPMAAYQPYFNRVPAVFEELELGLAYEEFRHASGWMNRLRHGLTWLKLQNYLKGLLSRFEAVTVASEKERGLVASLFPNVRSLRVVPNCIDLEGYQTRKGEIHPSRLIFTGSFRYQANYEAMRWFAGKVFPLILEQKPDAELVITGDHAGLPLPSEENIFLAGHVEDIQEMIAGSAVAIAPLLSGGGTRLKILEAMAIGTPVAATSKGAEGLDAVSGEHLLIADDPAEFADCVLRLMCDEDLRRYISSRARRLVQEKYDWSRVLPGYLPFIESLAKSQAKL